MNKISWGMIGCGDVTEQKNGPGLYLGEHCALAAITNRTYAKAVDWAQRHSHPTVYATVEELLADPRVQIVYIATTPDVHKELALRCAAAGKHIYIEKPIAPRYEDALEIADCCRQHGVRAFVAHYRRGLPQFRKAKELLESGALGELLGARIYCTTRPEDVNGWRADAKVAGGGHFFEADIHALDVVDYLLGPIADCHLHTDRCPDRPQLERRVAALFRWESGVIGSGLWCFEADRMEDSIELIGTRGQLSVSSGNLSAPLVLRQGGKTEEIRLPQPPYIGQLHEERIARVLLTGEEDPSLCTLQAGMRTLRLATFMRDTLEGRAPTWR